MTFILSLGFSFLVYFFYFLANKFFELGNKIRCIFSFSKIQLIFTALIVFILSYFLSFYLVNDDISMLLISSGKLNTTTNISSYVIFMNVFIGFLISSLYSLLNGVEWYTIIFLIFHTLSIYVILKNIMQLGISLFLKYSLIISTIILEYSIITELQFTTLSLNAGIASILLISKIKSNNKIFFLLASFLILSFCIRNFIGLMNFCLVAYLLVTISFFSKRIEKKVVLKFLIITFFLLFFLQVIDYLFYNLNIQFKGFRKIDSLRSLLSDGNNINPNLSGKFKKYDFYLIKAFFYDKTVFNTNYLKDLINILGFSLFDKFKYLLFTIYYFSYPIILYVIFNLMLKVNKKSILIIFFDLIMFIGVILISAFLFNVILKGYFVMTVFVLFIFKDIVFINNVQSKSISLFRDLILSFLILNIILYFNKHSFEFKLIVNLIVLLFFLSILLKSVFLEQSSIFGFIFLAVFSISISYQIKHEREINILNFTDVVDFISEKNRSKKIVTLPSHMCLENLDIYNVSNYKYIDKIKLNGWMVNYPLNENGFSSFKEIVLNKYPIIVDRNYKNSIQDLQKSILFHWNLKTEKSVLYIDKNVEVIVLNKIS